MTDDKGLGAIPIHLNAEQAYILAAHRQLKDALAAIKYPKSGRWEDRDTAVSVLEALAEYVAAFTDGEIDEEMDEETVVTSEHSELLQDLITHFRQAEWGIMDRRLAPNPEGVAGATHDDAINEFKRIALNFVDIVARNERAARTKDPVAEARRKVAGAYQALEIKIHTTRGGKARPVTARLLESWDKRPPEERAMVINRPTATPHNRTNLVRK